MLYEYDAVQRLLGEIVPMLILFLRSLYLHVVCLRPCFVFLFEDVGVMSAAILDIEEDMDLSPVQAEVLVGSLNVIAAFGGLIAGAWRVYLMYTVHVNCLWMTDVSTMEKLPCLPYG